MKTLWITLLKVVKVVLLVVLLLSMYASLLLSPFVLFFPIVVAPLCLFLIFQVLKWLLHALDEIEPPFPKHPS